jgi:D-aminopeptidase
MSPIERTNDGYGETQNERSERARKLATEEYDREITRAEARGRREAQVDARLDSHEVRLNVINGSMSRTAKALEGLREDFAAIVVSKKAIWGMQARQVGALSLLAGIVYGTLQVTGH